MIYFLENKIAPKSLGFTDDIYGIQFGSKLEDRNIKRVMVTLDPSLDAIAEAVKQKISLIISYRGLIHTPTKNFDDILVKKFYLLSKSRIILYVLHSAFDASQNGMTEILANQLFLKIENLFELKDISGKEIPLGRICTPEKLSNDTKPFLLEDLINRIKKVLNLKYMRYIGKLNHEINKICIMGIVTKDLLFKAIERGCDCYLTKEISYIDALLARDFRIKMIFIPHYKSEVFGMQELNKILSIEFPRDNFFFFDSNDPFSYVI